MTRIPANTGIIVLAAGRSRRFGADKRKAELSTGNGVLASTLASVPAAFNARLLVIRPGDEELLTEVSGWQVVIAEQAAAGMGHSLAAGIQHATALGWQAALIALGDMPFIRASTYHAVAAALLKADIVVPVFEGEMGHPAGFRQSCFGEMSRLEGDRGARSLITAGNHECLLLDCEDPGVCQDIDTPEDLTRF